MADDALVVLVEPRRMRDRAGEIIAEEVDLATTLASTWGASGDVPRLHLEFDRLLAHTDAPVWTMVPVADGPDTPVVATAGWAQASGDGAALIAQLRDLAAGGYRIIVAADGVGSAQRFDALLADLKSARRTGVAYDREEHTLGVCDVGVA